MTPTLMSHPATSDLLDAFEDELQCCTAPLTLYGRQRTFSGRIATVRCRDDNVLLRRLLDQAGEGRVLVVDGEGSPHRALIGARIVEMAQRNGWSGLVLNGRLRDALEIDAMNFGVYASGRIPRRSLKTGQGETNVIVQFGGVEFRPGEMLYADDDGIAVSTRDLVTALRTREAKAEPC